MRAMKDSGIEWIGEIPSEREVGSCHTDSILPLEATPRTTQNLGGMTSGFVRS